MEAILSRLTAIAENPYKWLAQWKQQTNNKVIGCFPMYVPEEIIDAAGVLPATILGSDEPIALADGYVQPYICALVRSNLDLALKGELDFLDGIVFPDICDAVTCMSDVWKRHLLTPFHCSLSLPARTDSPSSKQYLIQQLAAFKASLERFIGRGISEQALLQSIAVYNRNRALLSHLCEVRRAKPGLLRAKDVAAVVMAGMLMPRQEHNELLVALLEQVEPAGPKAKDGVRLVLAGNLCDDLDWGVLDLIEEVGGVVADDDLYVGTRWFGTPVPEHTDPIEALAQRHLGDVPCPTRHNPARDWGDHLLEVVRRSEAQGVVIFMLKFCEPMGFSYPFLKDRLTETGVPHLLLEMEQGKAPLGPIRTRLQAFVEMLK